jgi:hypothetical protein
MTTGIQYTKLAKFWSPGPSPEYFEFKDRLQPDISSVLWKFRFPTRLDRKLAANLRINCLRAGGTVPLNEEWPLEAIHNLWFSTEVSPATVIEWGCQVNRFCNPTAGYHDILRCD